MFMCLFSCSDGVKRTPTYVGMCFETVDSNPTTLQIISLKKIRTKSILGLFDDAESIQVTAKLIKGGSNSIIPNNMEPFGIPFNPNGYKKVNCPL